MLDKYDPATYNHQYATVNGIRMHYVDENSTSDKVLLLIHGWPDLWIGWREQIPFLIELGYRVIVPSLRGFGETMDLPILPILLNMVMVSSPRTWLVFWILWEKPEECNAYIKDFLARVDPVIPNKL